MANNVFKLISLNAQAKFVLLRNGRQFSLGTNKVTPVSFKPFI